MTDLWTEATRDIEAEGTARRLTAARLNTEPLLPFLRQASSLSDFDTRVSLAEDRLLATAGDLAGQVVAEVRQEVTARLTAEAANRCKCGRSSCKCDGACKCADDCTCARCAKTATASRSFRVEADAASGAYYVVDEKTGQDVGSYPDQAAAEQAAQQGASGDPLEVSHTPTGNPDTHGMSNGGPDASAAGGDSQSEMGPPAAPAAMPPGPDMGSVDPSTQAPDSAPTGEGDATQDDSSDASSNDESSDPTKMATRKTALGHPSHDWVKAADGDTRDPLAVCRNCGIVTNPDASKENSFPGVHTQCKTDAHHSRYSDSLLNQYDPHAGQRSLFAKKVATVDGFKVALQEGMDPLLPLLQLLDQGQGQPEVPSYHEDSQAEMGAPEGHANGEVGTSNPEGDFMSMPDAKKANLDNPFAAVASLTKSAIFFDVPKEVPARGGGTRPNRDGIEKMNGINKAVDQPTHEVLGDTHGTLVPPSKPHDDYTGHHGHDTDSLKGLVGHHVTVAGLGVSGMTGRHTTGKVLGVSKGMLPDTKEGFSDHPIWKHRDAGFHYSGDKNGYLHVEHQMGDWGGTQTMHGIIPIGGIRHVVDHGTEGVQKRDKG